MSKNTRDKAQRALDKITITKMYLEGCRLREIASEIGVTYQNIQYELNKIIQEWQKEAIQNIDQLKSIELQRINNLEARAWQSLEASEGEIVKTSEKSGTITPVKHPEDKIVLEGEITTTKEQQTADPRYMRIILDCIKTRCQILGIDVKDKDEDKNNFDPSKITINVNMPNMNNESK